MARHRKKQPRPATAKVPADTALLERDLGQWAGRRLARGGRRDALLGRVEALHLSLDGRAIEARVRGNRPLPYRVRVEVRGTGLAAQCTCSGVSREPCRHAVAAVETLRFPLPETAPARARSRRAIGRVAAGRGRIVQAAPAQPGFMIVGGAERTRTRDERIASARTEEVLLRRRRARNRRFRVEPWGTDGPPRFLVTPRVAAATHTVTMHGSAGIDRFACTCVDFAENELKTCEHVERVKSWRSRQRKSERRSAPDGTASLFWFPREWIDRMPVLLAEIRLDWPEGEMPATLARYFARDGRLLPAPKGRGDSSWVRAAGSAARRLAGKRGLCWDSDPEVASRIRAAAAEERHVARRISMIDNAEDWHDVIAGVAFDLHPYQAEGARFLAHSS